MTQHATGTVTRGERPVKAGPGEEQLAPDRGLAPGTSRAGRALLGAWLWAVTLLAASSCHGPSSPHSLSPGQTHTAPAGRCPRLTSKYSGFGRPARVGSCVAVAEAQSAAGS